MRILKDFFSTCELLFPLLIWVFMIGIFFAFSWFFNDDIDFSTFLLPISFLLSLYLGYYFSGKYHIFKTVKMGLIKKRPLLLLSLIGFSSVVLLFIANSGHLNKDISVIREEHLNQKSGGDSYDTLFMILFPLLIFSFIIANFNNHKHKIIINILCLLSCFAFIPIDGGRINFIIFIILYLCIYLSKNFSSILKKLGANMIKFLFILILFCAISTVYSVTRLGTESDTLVTYFSTLSDIDHSALAAVLRLPYGSGIGVCLWITTVYDYIGSNIYHLDIFIKGASKVNLGYGFYQFGFLDRFGALDWGATHEQIDNLYLKYGIEYNVWGTALRDLIVDFGVFGAFIFTFFLSLLFFKCRRHIERSYRAQFLYFLLFAFFMFAPFHSMFYLSRAYGFAFILALVMYADYLLKLGKKSSG